MEQEEENTPEFWKRHAIRLLKHFLNKKYIMESLRRLRALGSEELVQFATTAQPSVLPGAVAAWQSFLTELVLRIGIIMRFDKRGTTLPTFGSPEATTITPYVESIIRFVAAEAQILHGNNNQYTFLAGHAYNSEAPVPDAILFRRPHLPTPFPYAEYAAEMNTQPEDVLLVIEAKKANVVPDKGHPINLKSVGHTKFAKQNSQARKFREMLNSSSSASNTPTSSRQPSRLDLHTQLYSYALLHNSCYMSNSPLQQRNKPFLGLLTTMEHFWFMWSDAPLVDRGFCATPVPFPFLDLFNFFFKCYRELPSDGNSLKRINTWLAKHMTDVPFDKLALGETGAGSTSYCEALYAAAGTTTFQKIAQSFMDSQKPVPLQELSWENPPDIFMLLMALPFHDLTHSFAPAQPPAIPPDIPDHTSEHDADRSSSSASEDEEGPSEGGPQAPRHRSHDNRQQKGSHGKETQRSIGVVCDRALPGDTIVPKGVCAKFQLHPLPYNASILEPSRERSFRSLVALGAMAPTAGIEGLANELKSGVCVKVLFDAEAYETEVTTLVHAANKNCTVTPRVVCCGQVHEAQGFGEQPDDLPLYVVVTNFVGYPLFGDRDIFEKMNTPEWEQMKKEEPYKCRLKWFELQLHPKDIPELWNALQDCLKELRRCGIVHGDLKPDHFMVDPRDGKIKLIDFGSSEVIESYYIDNSAPINSRVRFNYSREPEDDLSKAVTPHFASQRINFRLRGGLDFRAIPSDDVASAFYSLMYWLTHEAPLKSRELGSPDPTISEQHQLYFAILGDIHQHYHLVPTVARRYLEPISESVRDELGGLPELGLPIPNSRCDDTTSLQIPLTGAPPAKKRGLHGISHQDKTKRRSHPPMPPSTSSSIGK